MKVKTKKIVAIIMLLLILLNSIPINSFAAFITDMNSNASFGVIDGTYANYGHELHYANYDGRDYLLFCMEYGQRSPTGREYSYNGEFLNQYKEQAPQYQRIAEMIYFGYTMDHGMGLPGGNDIQAACATQQYVWEQLGNAPGRDSWTGGSMSSDIYANWLATAESRYNQYHSNVSFSGATLQAGINETVVFNDTNGVLAHFEAFNKNVNGVNYVHDGGSNQLKATPTTSASASSVTFNSRDYGLYELMPNGARYDSSTMSNYMYIHFNDGAVQDLIFSNYVDPSVFTAKVEVQKSNVKVIKINNMGNKISGCKFGLYSDSNCNNKISEGTTNSNGEILFENLKPGTYFVKEISVTTGYLLDTSIKQIKVQNGETGEVSFKNNEPTGSLKLYKVSENNDKIQGATFKVTANEDIYNVARTKKYYTNGQEVATITTNANGIAEIGELPLGKYQVKEIQAPRGYLLNEKTYDVNLVYKDSVTPVIELQIEGIIDTEPRGSVTLIKKDSKTGTIAQGDASLQGAVYKLYANEDIYNFARSKKFYSKGDLVATRTTDAKGKTEDITNLPLGNYILKEETASLGYLLDKNIYDVKLEYKDQVTKVIINTTTSNEKVKEMGVHIFKSGIKVNSGETPGLEGSEFTIKLKSAVDKAIASGYTYEEIWNGINELGDKVEYNESRANEANAIAPTYEVIKTDRDGNAYTQNKLPYGIYIVKETETPKDYESAEDFTFSITDDETEIADIAKKTKHIVVNNEQQETYIKLIKKDAKTNKIVTLSNATFQIKATKDIYDRATKKILYKKGEAISQKIGSTTYNSFTTNADNLVVPNNSYNSKNDKKGSVTTPLKLEVGSYEITEIQLPEGFLVLDNPVTFKVEGLRNYDKDQDGDFIKEIVIKNEQPTGTLNLDKKVAIRENVDTSIIDISDLSGIEFKLTAKENIKDYSDGSNFYDKGQEIGTYSLTKDGKLNISELPMGIYEIEEIKTLDGLVLNKEKYEVKFEKQDDTTKVYTNDIEVSNDTTLISISKQDITGDKELPGAELSILDGDEVIDSWTSTEKQHTIEGLVVNKEYTLREEIAPEGYVKATEIKFTIKETNEIQEVKMIDKIVTMSKVDVGGEEIEGATIQVIDKDNNVVDEWTSEKTPHQIKGLFENEEYTLHEEVSAEGYVKATDVTFKVTEDKETQHEKLIDKIVTMSKEDIGGKEIEGATIQVIDKDNNIIDEWISEKTPHNIKNLVEGEKYILHEDVVIGDFVKATDVEFEVTTKKENQHITMIDKLVEITKTDITNGEELEGAELQVIDEEGNIIDEWISTKEAHKVKGLEEGKTYKLIEKTAPYGYYQTEEITFKVTTDKETQKIEMKDAPILKNIKVNKVDSETKEVIKDKFVFAIYRDEACADLIEEVKSNKEEGYALFKDLRYGTYYIKEVKAPKGYELSEKIVKVEINDKGIFVDGNQVEDVDNTITFDFEDKLIPTPNTGDNSHLKLAAGIIIFALGLIWVIIKFFKGKDN